MASNKYWEIYWSADLADDVVRYDTEGEFDRALNAFMNDTSLDYLGWRAVEHGVVIQPAVGLNGQAAIAEARALRAS